MKYYDIIIINKEHKFDYKKYVAAMQDMGLTKLAYSVNGYKQGYYYYAIAQTENIENLNKILQQDKNIIKYIVVALDETEFKEIAINGLDNNRWNYFNMSI